MKLLGALSFGLVLFSTIPDVVALPLPLSDQDLYARNPSLAAFLAAAAKKQKPHWHPVRPPVKPKPFFIRDDLEARDPTFAPTFIWKKPAFPLLRPGAKYSGLKPFKVFRREDDDDDALASAITDLVVADLTKGIAARAFEDLEVREPINPVLINAAVSAAPHVIPPVVNAIKKLFSWFRRDVFDDEIDQIFTNWNKGRPPKGRGCRSENPAPGLNCIMH